MINILNLPTQTLTLEQLFMQHPFYVALFLAMWLDILTGVAASIGTRTLNSNISWRGTMKKMSMWLVVALAAITGQIAGFGGIKLGDATLTMGSVVALGFFVGEALSVLENAGKLGILPPIILKDALSKLNTTTVQVQAAPDAKVVTVVEPILDSLPGGQRKTDPPGIKE